MAATSETAAAPAEWVGSKTCRPCHETEWKLWLGSDHDLAMQLPTPATVKGDFSGKTFEKDGVVTTFSRRGDDYFVRTDGPDGKLHDYRVAYVFGVDPLQQVLLELPDGRGRLQALSIAWDTRPAAAGGQRWFHLYPNEKIDHTDVLHWAGPAQNWNHMCADCHSTNLRKGFDAKADRFSTTWTDVDVACEACHGAGSAHVRWAEEARAGRASADPKRGFAFPIVDASGGEWKLGPGASIAHRTKPPSSRAEVETCGRCHSRRAQIWGDPHPGEPLAQAFRVALLDPGLYHDDGQIEDEVYEYGSFLQSRMYAAGVTCSDCHDPHSLKLRGSGNEVCAQCHLPARFDTAAHHFHAPGSPGARCASCHMPERFYMVVDGRHDHGFRVPRPDLTMKIGTPNACNDCHTDKSPEWAAAAIEKRSAGGANPAKTWHFGEAIHAGRTSRADAEAQLLRAIGDASVPAIARASAMSLLAAHLGPQSLPPLRQALRDESPLVRRAAAETAAAIDPQARVALVAPLLRDPTRTVRLEALGSLLDVPGFSPDAPIDGLGDAIREYREAQAVNADRADAHANLGMLELRLGDPETARREFRTAIRLQPTFSPAYLNLADLERRAGREEDAQATLREGLRVLPDDADLHESLGLALVRAKRLPEALPELARAAELRPGDARYAFVYAVALNDTGDARSAIEVLRRAHERNPASREILTALVEYEAKAGNRAAVLAWARKLYALTGDPQVQGLIASLEGQPPR